MVTSLSGAKLRHYRLLLGLKQRQVATVVQRDRSWLAHVERGDYIPNLEQLYTLAKFLNIPQADMEAKKSSPICSSPGDMKRVCRTVVRRFSLSCGERCETRDSLPREGWAEREKLYSWLKANVDDEHLRGKFRKISLGSLEIAFLALELWKRGGAFGRISWSQVGFPLSIADRDGLCINHLARPCIAWSGREVSLVLFGEYCESSERYVPPWIAWTREKERRYIFLDSRGTATNKCATVGRNSLKLKLLRNISHRNLSLYRLYLNSVKRIDIVDWLDSMLNIL